MKKLLIQILTLFSFFFLFSIISPKIVHASTESYKITDAFQTHSVISGNIYFYTNVGFNYHGGNIIVSKNPDGTGEMNVGDWLQIARLDGGPQYNYKPYSYNCATIPMAPTDITSTFSDQRTSYVTLIRLLDVCGGTKNFSSMYLVIKNIPDSTPSPTLTPMPTATLVPTVRPTIVPTFTPTSIPISPKPFLNLPWDYKSKGLSFNQAALSMTSYFDHTYPLLSSGLKELNSTLNQITTFENEISSVKNYSSHDGYDYSRSAKALLGDPVLAAAKGTATYVSNCSACGNMVLIDHHNGYQTRYMHMQRDGLITNIPEKNVEVEVGQPIGKIGATGNVFPQGDQGAHIHFMVIADKNHDGNFSDNIPDGITDPFGWQSTQPDPWPNYSFSYAGKQRTGNTSSYLWTDTIDSIKKTITTAGGTAQNDNFTLKFPLNIVHTDSQLELHSAPTIKLDSLSSIGNSIVAIMKDGLGEFIHQFDQSFSITADFNGQDLSSYKLNSLFLYSTNDGKTWKKENTTIDMNTKTATAKVNHLTTFAFMGEKKDTMAPKTTAYLKGIQGQDNWYRSNVKLELQAKDPVKGAGVDYTMYKLNNDDWEVYSTPLTFKKDKDYTVQFYSADTQENIEHIQTIRFHIDKKVPEVKIQFDKKMNMFKISSMDSNSFIKIIEKNFRNTFFRIQVFDKAGNTLTLQINRDYYGKSIEMAINNLRYNNSAPISLGKTAISVLLQLDDKKNKVKTLNQVFTLNDKLKLNLEYEPAFDKTFMMKIDNKKTEISQIMQGMKWFSLHSDNGKMVYSVD